MGYGCTEGLNNTNESVGGGPESLEWGIGPSFSSFPDYLKILSSVFILLSRSDQLLQKHKCFNFFLLFSLKASHFIHYFYNSEVSCSRTRLCCFCCVPCDTKTNYFALPLIDPTVTQKHFSVSLKTKPGKMSIHKCLCSPQTDNIVLGIKR